MDKEREALLKKIDEVHGTIKDLPRDTLLHQLAILIHEMSDGERMAYLARLRGNKG